MKLFNIIMILVFLSSCNANQSNKGLNPDKLGMDTAADTYSVESTDVTMNQAITEAIKTISMFDKALKSNNPTCTDFALKKRYKTTDNGGEHMWIAGITIVDGKYKGFVNNNAEKTKEVKYGDTVIVQKDEITDWMYLENNTLRGGYTIREIRNHMNKEDRINFEKELGIKIED